MKPVLLSLIVLASLLATLFTRSQIPAPFAEPEDVADELPRLVRVQAEFIEMPHTTFTALMAKPRRSANDTDLRAQCAELIETRKATIIESFSINTPPGYSATSEAITEVIFPTEIEPPVLPNKIRSPQEAPAPPVARPIGSPPSPSAFDTKNVGSTLEVEAQIDSNDIIVELRLSPTIVYHADDVVWSTWEANGAKIETSMPLFYVLSAKTGATVITGQPHMLSALSPKNDKGFMDSSRKIMIFVRADIITVGK